MKKIIFTTLLIALSNVAFADGSMANDGNLYRVAANVSESKDADNKALDACKQAGGSNCKIIARFTRGCWAISKDRQLGKSAPALGYPTVEEAKAAALQNCLHSGGVNCIVTDNQGCERSSLAQQNWPKDNNQVQKNGSNQNTTLQIQRRDCEKLDGWWSRFRCRGEEYERKENEANLNNLRSQCDGFGFQRGTNEYAQCMMQLQSQENANAQAAAQRQSEILKPPPMVDLKADVINQESSPPLYNFSPSFDSRHCTSTVNGNQVYTSCH